MLRSRIAAAAVGAVALGVSAALVPAVSNAETPATTPTASPVVTWKDAAGDFTRVAVADTIPLNQNWYFADLADDSAKSITDIATLDEDGLSVSDGDAVGLVHGLTAAVDGKNLPKLVAAASAKTTGATSIGLVLQEKGTDTAQRAVVAADGLQGADTTWIDPEESGTETTSELAAQLQEDGTTVVGTIVYLGIDVAPTPAPAPTTPPATETPAPDATDTPAPDATDTPAPAPTETPAPATDAPAPLELRSQSSRLAADASASISALTVGDTTTYFTPQPTAAVKLLATSATVTEATTTGIRVQGSGFAPGEVVTAGVGTSEQGTELPGSLVADEDGNVSGTVVLPADFVVDPGTYTVTLIGASSGQSASTTVTVTADPAAVAVPVPGTATFTG